MNREIFHIPAGFDLNVDYGPVGQVCTLKVPAMMPRDPAARVSNTTDLKQRMHDFLADLVPASERGKQTGGFVQIFGLPSLSTIEYENVTVSELQNDSQPENGTITIRFKHAGCETP